MMYKLSVAVALGLGSLAAPVARAQVMTWEPLPMFGPREGHCMAHDPIRDRVVVFGGTNCDYGVPMRADTWEWDGQRWSKRFPVTSPPGRYGAEMAFDHVRGTIILFGGLTAWGATGVWAQDTWEWDGQDWRDITPQVVPPPRIRFCMGSDPVRRQIVLFGGSQDPWGGITLGDTWVWDGRTWTQRSPATNPVFRATASMAWCGASNRVLMYGGGAGAYFSLDHCWEWDGNDWHEYTGPTPGRRASVVLSAVPWNGRVILHGGIRLGPPPQYVVDLPIDTWEWNGSSWAQIAAPHQPGCREWGRLAPHVASGHLVYYGGLFRGGNGVSSSTPGTDPQDQQESTWVFQQGDWARRAGLEPPKLEAWVAVEEPARDRTLLLSTVNGNTAWPTFESWVLEGERLRRLPGVVSPPFREWPAISYHEGLQRVVLFGGKLRGIYQGDTWVWDGVRWTQDLTPGGASPGYGTTTYDPARQAVVMIQPDSQQVWEWRGQGWQVRPAAQLPFAGRRGFGLFLDPRRGTLIFAGGRTFMPGTAIWISDHDDTWEFDGTSWRQLQPTNHPPARYYDNGPVFKPVAQLGGVLGIGFQNLVIQHWLWDGADWRQVFPQRELPPPSLFTHPIPAETGRGLLRAIRPSLCHFGPTESMIWHLVIRTLTASTQHPRLGQRLDYSLNLPTQPGSLAALLFSGADWPGMPLPGVTGRVLPLRDDGVLQASLGAGLWTVLDPQGRGSVGLTVPTNPVLVGVRLRSAALTFDPRAGALGPVTNEVPIDILP